MGHEGAKIAWREPVLNALTHRDYQHSGEVLVRHSAKELEVTSPGGFVDGITPENILRHEALPRNRTLDAQGAEVGLDQLLVLDALRGHDFIDTAQAAGVLQLTRDDARRVLDGMCQPPLNLIERKGHTAAATFHFSKGIAKELKGKAAYTKTRGLDPIRYAEMVHEYLKDHHQVRNAELRELLGLGNSASAQVEASRYLKKWSQPDGFLEKIGDGGNTHYILLKTS